MFVLHEQLRKDCIVIGELPLSTLLLMNDANYPWFVLVPRSEGKREWYELPEKDQQQLLREVWGATHVQDTHYLRIVLGRLRQKLGDDPAAPRWLKTEPGIGYRFLDGSGDESAPS